MRPINTSIDMHSRTHSTHTKQSKRWNDFFNWNESDLCYFTPLKECTLHETSFAYIFFVSLQVNRVQKLLSQLFSRFTVLDNREEWKKYRNFFCFSPYDLCKQKKFQLDHSNSVINFAKCLIIKLKIITSKYRSNLVVHRPVLAAKRALCMALR